MFRAAVAVGLSTLGNTGMMHPPINSATTKNFDSTRNDDSTIFVCYHDSQYYPQYLMSYSVVMDVQEFDGHEQRLWHFDH